jgi:hypothetical protein
VISSPQGETPETNCVRQEMKKHDAVP